MRLLSRRRSEDVETRTSLQELGIPSPANAGVLSSGVTVNQDTASGVPAVIACVRRAAQGVAMLELSCWKGPKNKPERVTSTWQARLFAGDPNDQQNDFDFKETIEESISYRGNAFIWKNKDPKTGRVAEWYALHPDQVLPMISYKQRLRTYIVGVRPGFVDPTGKGNGFYEVGPDTILHIKGFGNGGTWIAPSPIDRMRGGGVIGSALAQTSHLNSTYKNGAAVRGAMTFPESLPREKVDAFRESFQQFEGAYNAGKTLVLGGGATFAPIGLTMADAQFVESQQFSIEEVCRVFDIPAALVGSGGAGGTGKAVASLTPEHETYRWLAYYLEPRLKRIEAAIKADPDLFLPGASTYPRFDSQGVLRGDLATEALIEHQQIQDGTLLVDEARAQHGRPPLPNGAGQIPVINPAGAGATPDQFLPDASAPDTEPEAA